MDPFPNTYSSLILKGIEPGETTEVVLDMEDPFVLPIRGCRKIHKIYLYTVHTTVRDNRLQGTLELVGLVQGTDSTAVNDPFAVVLCDAVNSWDNKLVSMFHAAMVILDMGFANSVKRVPLASRNPVRIVNLE